jgi:hypothetical protein
MSATILLVIELSLRFIVSLSFGTGICIIVGFGMFSLMEPMVRVFDTVACRFHRR